MVKHLTKNCSKCPEFVKKSLKENKDRSTNVTLLHEETINVDDPDGVQIIEDQQTLNGSADSFINISFLNQQVLARNKSHTQQDQLDVPPTKKAREGLHSFFDSISKSEKESLDELFARAVYAKGYPLSLFEGSDMIAAFKKLRPSYKPPSFYQLGGKLLDNEYDKVMKSVSLKMSKALSLTVMSDGWTNRRSEALINFVLGTPDPIFFKSIELGIQRENSVYISNQLISVIEELGPSRVMLIVTDNTSAMRAAWQLVQVKFTHIYAIGCGSHCLNLLFKDFMMTTLLKTLLQKVKTILKLKKKRLIMAVFREKQKEKYGSDAVSLITPAPTRFAGAYLTFKSLQANKRALQETVLSEDLNIPSNMRTYILDDVGFWSDLTFAINFLQPTVDGTLLVEADDAKLSHTVAIFINIRNNITENSLNKSPFSPVDVSKIMKALKYRMNFCMKDLHKATYYLDPNFCGRGLNDMEILAATKVIQDIATTLKLDVDKVIHNLLDFRTKRGFYQNEILWKTAKSSDPVKWWNGFCQQQPIYPVAVRLLSLLPSSASCERIWSDYEHIHSKKRNRLLNKKTEKLVAVKANLQILRRENLPYQEISEKRRKIITELSAATPLLESDEEGEENNNREFSEFPDNYAYELYDSDTFSDSSSLSSVTDPDDFLE